MKKAYLLLLALPLSACSTASGGERFPWPGGDVVIVDDDDRDRDRDRRDRPRSLRGIPPGHYPPPGECRIWYPNRPAGQQPPPSRCGRLEGRVPYGAFLLYNDREWDTEYDWRSAERRRPGSVPDAVLRIMRSLQRN